MPKLIVSEIGRDTDYITVAVVYQEYTGFRFVASNGWSIRSVSYPEFSYGDKTLYVRGGESDKNNRPVTIRHANWKLVKVAIAEYNNGGVKKVNSDTDMQRCAP